MKFFKQLKLKNILMLTIAGIINAVGVTMFLQPVRLYDSGISGTSMLLGQLTPDFLSLSFFLAVLNIPIFLFGAKKPGRCFHILRRLCCGDIFAVGLADNGYFAD